MKKKIGLFAVLSMVILAGYLGNACSISESGEVTVSYNANGGQASRISDTASAGKNVVLPAATRAGFIFIGWHTALDGGVRVGGQDDSYNVEMNITLFAQWTPSVTVFYNANEGSISPNTQTVIVGGSITLPAPSRIGYTFRGWYNSKGEFVGTSGDEYSVYGERIFQGSLIESLMAEWRLNVTVSFNVTGGDNLLPSVVAPTESSITLPNSTREGYLFGGWYDTITGGTLAGMAGDNYTIPINARATMELFARWMPGEVTIIYNANGGDVFPLTVTVPPGSVITLPIPTRGGYIFNGWFSAISGGTKVGSADGTYTVGVSITLYAQWS